MPKLTPEEAMRSYLLGESMRRIRRPFRQIPSDPHCKRCVAPFGGIGGAVMGRFGFGRFAGNPAIRNDRIKGLNKAA